MPGPHYLGSVAPGHVVPAKLKFAPQLDRFFSPLISKVEYVTPEYSIPAARKVFSRFHKPAVHIPLASFNKATVWMNRIWLPYMTVHPWTHEQVISDLDLKTSPGWPYNQVFGTKRELVDACGTDWLKASYELYSYAPHFTVFDQSLKEELRLVGKDPRGIIAAPIDQVYVSKRVLAAQTAAFYLSKLTTPSAVGMTREYLGWNTLFNKLNKHPRGISLDIRRFDARMHPLVLQRIRDMRIRAGADPVLTRAIYDQLCHSVVRLPDGSLWAKDGGNPSGSTTTTSDNTQADFLANTTCLIEQFPEMTFEEYREFFAPFFYGDDHIVTTSWEVDWDLHRDYLVRFFGYETTVEAQGAPIDLVFLSGQFRQFYVDTICFVVPVMDAVKMAHHLLFKNRHVSHERILERLFAIRRLDPFDEPLMECVTAAIAYIAPSVPSPIYARYHVSLAEAQSMYLIPSLEHNRLY
jgi:hypothetical protein